MNTRVLTCVYAIVLTSTLLLAGNLLSADEAKSKPWDVQDPLSPKRYDVSLDTDEGTWLSLDVSPDGKDIVFDLLGDIYILDLGGKAKPLTSGIAWDMQPTFSPDGKRIAFTSDRGGGDNIWIMDRDGENLRQVTKESFRLLNSPTWTPDGQYIAARKHFSSRRSLGAGEIWLYHWTGGQGLQMVARPNDQQDLGEPAFSPDGRYLYYSQDDTAGNTFEYNKDSNGEIYVIKRLDRKTGRVERSASGPGGAIRPTPSPDGSKIAFVRRVRFKSVLFIQDLKSGREWPVYDDLERDMQETWAIHGVYPRMAWTPDNSSLVFWAKGKIRRLDLDTKVTHVIPFRVEHTRSVATPRRLPIEVAPKKFDTKMLRWVQVSPDKKHVLFQSLGHLWVRALPEGKPRRLTTQEEHFEYYPSFSRDGQSVVYVSWHDAKLSTIRQVSLAGAELRIWTKEPGHYADPALSPDGKTLVYRKTSGGHLRDPAWSKNTGLYAIAEDGEPRQLRRSGSNPHFGTSSDRVFFSGSGLQSIGLDGLDERTHFTSSNATEMRVSPDGKWFAFAERFKAFVAPFIHTGKAIAVGPGTGSYPVHQVSKHAGEYLHWSGDSSKLHWSLGAELFTRELKHSFAFLEGAPKKLPEKPSKGINIGMKFPYDVPTGTIALVGGRLITMKGDEIIENGTIIVEGNRIAQIGPSASIRVPDGAHVVDVKGQTLMPGLVDVHAHGAQGTQELIPQQNWVSYSELSFGVTTIHDPSSDTSTIFAASEMAKAGRIVSPRVFSTGTILYGAAGSFKAEIDSLDDARFHLGRMKAVGAFSVKSYNQPRRNQRQQVIEASRELGMMVVPEGGSLFQHNMTMVVDGHTGVEHCLPVANIYNDVVQLWSATPVGYTPTLGVAYGGLSGEKYWYHKTQVWANERLLSFVPRTIVDSIARRPAMAPDSEYNHINAARVCKKLTDAGVRVNLGAHGQREGLAAHWEIWMFEQGGMTPHEALRSATFNGAWYLGLDDDIGSLEAGKLADILVLSANPLENIRDSEKIRYTMINGRLFDAATLNELGNHPRQRTPFYWERAGGMSPDPAAYTHTCGCSHGRH